MDVNKEVAAEFTPSTAQPLRLALVIAGAVSLGSYEAGALTALLKSVWASDGRIVIDTIVGASAGSITGLLLAHTLLTGNGLEDQRKLWVDETDLRLLLKGSDMAGRPRAPLSPKLLVEWAWKRLSGQEPDGGGQDNRGEPIQRESIYLVMSIANLQGITYRMMSAAQNDAVRADTYRDAASFALAPGIDVSTWRSAMDVAQASSAHAFAFSAMKLTRSRSQYPPEVVWNGNGDKVFWYTDGGTVYNEPFGTALDAVYSSKDVGLPQRDLGETGRVFLLIHPHPDDPLTPWPPGGEPPVFGQSSLRAFNMQRAQSLYEDLLRLEKYNGRVSWRANLERAMRREGLEEQPWLKELAAQATAERARRHQLTKLPQGEATGSPEPATNAAAAAAKEERSSLEIVLDAATGTAGKVTAHVEVVSPDLDPRVRSQECKVGELLAGERLGHFLGFADIRARKSDFRLGYENFRQWWQETTHRRAFRLRYGLSDVNVPEDQSSSWKEFGSFDLSSIPPLRRFVWGVQLLARYYKEVRALRKALKRT